MAEPIVFEHIYGVFGERKRYTNRHSSLGIFIPSSESHLFVIVIAILIDHIKEPQFVDPLACGDDPQPVSELLLLEKLLCPVQTLSASGIPALHGS